MSLFNELKRRNVIKVALAYLVASWLTLQITDVLMSVLGLSESAGKFVFLLLVIGFIPVQDDVGVPSVAIQLGLSLVELSGATAAYVDANVRFPALAAMSVGQDLTAPNEVFSTRWLKGSLALLTPHKAERAGEAVPALASLLLDGTALFEHVLVDLTGFDRLGEPAPKRLGLGDRLPIGPALDRETVGQVPLHRLGDLFQLA